ncbi:mu-type opioid receptor-like [Danio aesculapii]|uniref:mu-type opioid receptor-like n=1 Tax=Danio aesculapii TaxID=1142201 RepID=UPI0024BF154B|nr:mu-type opioid receptor-like [Danio aesculapii]
MNNSTMNFTSPEGSTNSTSAFIGIFDVVELCVYGFNLLFGLPTHSYVLWLVIIRSGSGASSEFFIFNLSVCEIINSLNSFIYILSVFLASLSKFETFLIGFTITGRPLFQCLICVERYLAVVHPVTFLKYKPLRYRVICCAVAWILTFGSCLCSLFTIFPQTTVHVWYLTVQHKLVLCVQLFCLVAVLRALKQSGPGERKKEENHMKRRAFHLILITTVTSVILYAPFSITALFTILSGKTVKVFWVTSLTLYVLASFVQPVLYVQRTGKLSCLRAA